MMKMTWAQGCRWGWAGTALLLFGAGVGTPAAAQQVTLYGLIDAGVERVSNVGASGSGLTRMTTNTGSLPSRWGIRGTEDLGAGLKAGFTLESGFGPDTGVLGQGGRMFGRQAWVSLAGDWGQVALGRQYTMLFWGTLGADFLGPHAFGLGSLDSYIPNSRVDNALSYKGTFGGFTAGATYSLGRDTASGNNPAATNCPGESSTDSKACRAWSWMLKYDQADWGAALGQDRLRGGEGSWAAAGLTNSGLTDVRTFVNGYARLGSVKLGAGLIRRNNQGSAAAPRSDLYHVVAAYGLTPSVTLEAMASQLNFRDSSNGANLYVLRSTWALSKRTAAYASVGYVDNKGLSSYSVSSGAAGSNPIAGGNQNGVLVGVRHAF